MKTRIITTAAIMGALVAIATGDVLAARNGGGRGASGNSVSSGSTVTTRPVGSQRRDGTFLTTGTTANGSTTRQGMGNGLRNGTCTTATPVVATPVQ